VDLRRQSQEQLNEGAQSKVTSLRPSFSQLGGSVGEPEVEITPRPYGGHRGVGGLRIGGGTGGSDLAEARPMPFLGRSPATRAPSRTPRGTPREDASATPRQRSRSSSQRPSVRSQSEGPSLRGDALRRSFLSKSQDSVASQRKESVVSFGVGERVDPSKYTTLLQAGHEAYIVQGFAAKEKQAAFVRARNESDQAYADMLTEPNIEGVGVEAKRASTPRPLDQPMRTAFTDRSIRMREGRGGRAALIHDDPFEKHMDVDYKSCSCPACRPFEMKPAGQPSHEVQVNKYPKALQDSIAMTPRRRLKSARSDDGEPAAGKYERKSFLQEDEAGILEWRHRRGPSMPSSLAKKSGEGARRSHSADPTPAAGEHRKRGFMLQDEEGQWVGKTRKGPLQPPSLIETAEEMRMTMAPSQADPPPSARITSAKKAEGLSKHGVTKHAEMLSTHWDRPLFRYEMWALEEQQGRDVKPLRRAGSAPPGGRFSGEKENGVPHAGVPVPGHGARNPVTMEGEEVPLSRSRIHQNRSNTSHLFRMASNHEEGAKENEWARSIRLATDTSFADICKVTVDVKTSDTEAFQKIKDERLSGLSRGMAASLAWEP